MAEDAFRVAPGKLLAELAGKVVIVDTDSHIMYLGCLESSDGEFLKLSRCDVHEVSGAPVGKERYAHEAKHIGVRPNREMAYIRWARVLSVSRLEDMSEY